MQLDFISAKGDVLPLWNNEWFYLTNVDGHTQVASAISTNAAGGIDGDTVTNIQANARSIVLDLQIRQEKNVELAKREILRFVKPKQTAALEWTQKNRTVKIYGVVESIEMPRWTNNAVMQITLYCSRPFWEDAEIVVQQISDSLNHHYFTDYMNDGLLFPEGGIVMGEYDISRTKTYYNYGDVSTGLEITIHAISSVTNPIIYNENSNFFGIGYGTGAKQFHMEAGDYVVINTEKGNKSVTINGVNCMALIKPASTWMQFETGENIFSINSDNESTSNMYFTLTYKQKYV